MQAGDPRGFYEVLGIGRTASADEVRRAFRDRAKRYHPDRAGAAADGARFQHLREAFEVLRDPQRRMRYDADSDGVANATANFWDRYARSGRLAEARDVALQLFARWRRDRRAVAIAAGCLLAPLLLGLTWLAPVRARHERQDQPVVAAPDSMVEAMPAGEARYRAELVFPRGSAELTAMPARRAAAIVSDLHGAIARLPPGSLWTVMLSGEARRFAGASADMIGPWQLTIHRLAAATDYLTGQGVPGERIAASFQSGPVPSRLALSVPEAIQITLLCCNAATEP